MEPGKQWTYREKLLQANREARATLVALAFVVAAWLVGGFGLSAFDIELFSTPIWVFGGTLGVWAAAIVAAVVLGRRVFADFDLESERESASGATVPVGEAGGQSSGAGESHDTHDGCAPESAPDTGESGHVGNSGRSRNAEGVCHE